MEKKKSLFELSDKNSRILPQHKCLNCESILLEVFECKEDRSAYCQNHLPKSE